MKGLRKCLPVNFVTQASKRNLFMTVTAPEDFITMSTSHFITIHFLTSLLLTSLLISFPFIPISSGASVGWVIKKLTRRMRTSYHNLIQAVESRVKCQSTAQWMNLSSPGDGVSISFSNQSIQDGVSMVLILPNKKIQAKACTLEYS